MNNQARDSSGRNKIRRKTNTSAPRDRRRYPVEAATDVLHDTRQSPELITSVESEIRSTSSLGLLPDAEDEVFTASDAPRPQAAEYRRTPTTNLGFRKQNVRPNQKELSSVVPAAVLPSNSVFRRDHRDGHTAFMQAMPDDTAPTSIGFPSVVQVTDLPASNPGDVLRQFPPPVARRTISSDVTPKHSPTHTRSPVMLDSDSRKILHLMKTLCGRMHGILFYRAIGTSSWHSGYCAVNVAPGSLATYVKGEPIPTNVLIPDLRGCTVRTQYEVASQSTYLTVVSPLSGHGYQLRPPIPETFDSWLAALLCWQPLRPKGAHNKMSKPQSFSDPDMQTRNGRRLSDVTTSKGAATIKAGQLYIWDGPLPPGSLKQSIKRQKLSEHNKKALCWKRINCTLHENGLLRLLSDESSKQNRTIHLNTLLRCAVQRLDSSILDAPFCLAVYLQHAVTLSPSPKELPLILCFASRAAYEAWYVLLRSFTVPELYGPENVLPLPQSETKSYAYADQTGMFRMERSISVKITEAKFSKVLNGPPGNVGSSSRPATLGAPSIYADILLDRDLRARTAVKELKQNVFWAEDFDLPDIPATLGSLSIVLKLGNPDEMEWTMTSNHKYELDIDTGMPDLEGIEVTAHDPVHSHVKILLSDIEGQSISEKWWELIDASGDHVGQISLRIDLIEVIVLMDKEYAEVKELLHSFSNGLSSQISQVIGSELRQLSDTLLDIFQSSGQVEQWINSLVEEEVDGIYREQPPSRMRFSARVSSHGSRESGEQRNVVVRELSRTATMEANLLFRGNSLVTKAFDSHMRRVGREYLEKTLGQSLRNIVDGDLDCEVDPNKVKSSERLSRNWTTLITLTRSVWQAIAASVSKCPPSMRAILKHIKSCAEETYDSFAKTVKYTSVSGFLFLRFFCPAILNPKLFGLLEEHPPDRPRRTLTLIAKSLISLANMSRIGQKEPWMEPMNRFVNAATPEFREFITEICSIPEAHTVQHEAQYQAASQVRARLESFSQEGLPSLPFLIDGSRAIASLVDLWVQHAPQNIADIGVDKSLQAFHHMCLYLKLRTQEVLTLAEGAAAPDRGQEAEWQKLLSFKPSGGDPFEDMRLSPSREIVILPQRPATGDSAPPSAFRRLNLTQSNSDRIISRPTANSSRPRTQEAHRDVYAIFPNSSNNSSNVSLSSQDDRQKRYSTSRNGSTARGKLLDLARFRIDRRGSTDIDTTR